MNSTLLLDQFQTLRELNRAFLERLQSRVRLGESPFGLPTDLWPVVQAASPALLDALADFPRALFCLELGLCEGARGGYGASDLADYHLAASILHAVRGASRQSAYHAQLVFGLDSAAATRCRALTLDDLRHLAATPGLLRCAHAERPWLWQGFLTASRPETRRQLTLMALQPVARQGWPARRPPRPMR